MRKIVFFLAVLTFCSCQQKEQTSTKLNTYFDIRGYFEKEISRLTKLNPIITKTVRINENVEQKKLSIKSWKQELQSFIDADINKASWKGSFKVEKNGNLTTYTANSDKIPVKNITVALNGSRVVSVKILVNNDNNLYISQDSLVYFPDSIYQIKKTQSIKLMNPKSYQVIGKFN